MNSKASDYLHVNHEIPPVFNNESQILILGSFPSVKSREGCFFYHHPQNRFWKVMSALTKEALPETIEAKRALLLKHHIALWDVIASCDIYGSSDASIKNVVPNDLSVILNNAPVKRIFCNGAASYRLYSKYTFKATQIPSVRLPSTSPANAACSLESLIDIWKNAIELQ